MLHLIGIFADMRDVIWTIIAIWLIYKLVDIFRISGSKSSSAPKKASSESVTLNLRNDDRTAVRKSADSEGEYVDYEEVK